MLRVKRFSKVTDKVKEIGKSIEHTVTHPKETKLVRRWWSM